jgi:prepilin-type N-terminal cleavage/methylation domain-containing protein
MTSNHGFTLVEIMVALLVLAVGVLSTLSGMVLAARTVNAAGARTRVGAESAGRLELWIGTTCGTGLASRPADAAGSWSAVGLGHSVATATVVTAVPEGPRARQDTFTVTGDCR